MDGSTMRFPQVVRGWNLGDCSTCSEMHTVFQMEVYAKMSVGKSWMRVYNAGKGESDSPFNS